MIFHGSLELRATLGGELKAEERFPKAFTRVGEPIVELSFADIEFGG
jgi:hypothetical protein